MEKQKNKDKLYEIIFEADTKLGKRFDLVLIIFILLSIVAVMLESVESIQSQIGDFLTVVEWIITIAFTIEYIVRISIVNKPLKFATSFFGLIDLLSCLPTYIGVIVTGTQGLIVIRALRLLRIFRILKLNRYMDESSYLVNALKASRYKISIFLYAVLMIVIVVGAIMYLVEGEANGFDSIPRSMYWVIVTITTVGFGDIVPLTTIGQFIASFIMILGYAIIAVPTGIVTAELGKAKSAITKINYCCSNCFNEDHDHDAHFCKTCGANLDNRKAT